jgi:hypothetical protein
MSAAPGRPAIRSRWTPDGVDVAHVAATWSDGVVVIWDEARESRRSIYTPLSKFYSEFSRHVEPFDPTRHADRFTEAP